MKFTLAPTDENFQNLRFLSENGLFELGLTQMMFGVRVRAGRVGAVGPCVDYCAGPDPVFQGELLVVITQILETFPEDVGEVELSEFMPTYQRRPVNQDPCWEKLKQLALDRKPKNA